MATIGCDPNGLKRILFVDHDGKRQTIRLGKATMKQAEAVKVKVEALVAARIAGVMDDEVARWLAGLGEIMHGRLSAVGLVPKRQAIRLKQFLDAYVQERCDVKSSTALVYGHTRRNLVEHFGPEKALREITPGDADQWRLYLIGQGLSDNTVRRRCGIAKQFFRAALRRRLISSNSFVDLKASVQANKQREYFVNREMAQKVLDACPDPEWKLLFALSRYGGLRCPSEHLQLKWKDVDWTLNRITIHSPKTEHHVNGGSRVIPLFPELKPFLVAAFDQAVLEHGEVQNQYIITKYRSGNCNLRTQLERIITRAGLESWPKLFQNLRSTRETELAESWPIHVVCAWIGNSQAVAKKHYLQVTEEHMVKAARAGKEQAAQNPAQQTAAERCNATQAIREQDQDADVTPLNCDTSRDPASGCDNTQDLIVGDTGLEPVTSRV